MARKFEVYTKLEQERVYIVEAESTEDAKRKLEHALTDDYYDISFPFDISDYCAEELTGEVHEFGS